MKKKLILILLALLFIGSLFTNAPYQYLTMRTIESARIKDKQISTESQKKDGKVKSTYLIYTDHGVFRNDDAGWHMKFNSSDLYGNLDKGESYRLTVYGWRIPILSMYPNIVRARPIAHKKNTIEKDTK